MFILTRQLPLSLQNLLARFSYGKRDIGLEATETVSPQLGGAAGRRGFVAILNLESGESQAFEGSWGGQNAFTVNRVDSDETLYRIPPNVVVVKGYTGYPYSTATLYAAPGTVAPLLPSGVKMSDREVAILSAYRGLRSGPYRQEALALYGEDEIKALVTRGLLKESRNGARQITTEGKNALTGQKGPSGLPYR